MKFILSLIIVLTPVLGMTQIEIGAGFSFIPVISTETVMINHSSQGPNPTLAINPAFNLKTLFQLRSNLTVNGLFHIILLEKEKLSFGFDLLANGGVHLPWTEAADEIALMYSVGGNIFIENKKEYNLFLGYKMSFGGLHMRHPITGFSTSNMQFYLSSFRFKHYRQLSNGDFVTSKRIWEIGVNFFFFNSSDRK